MIRPNFDSIRLRLTAWHSLIFGGILVLFATGTAAFVMLTLDHQLDTSLKEDLEIFEQLLAESPEGSFPLDTHSNPVNPLERYIEMWSLDGRLLYRSRTLEGRVLGGPPQSSETSNTIQIRSIVLPDDSRWRVASTATSPHGRPLLIRLAVSEQEFYSDIRTFVSVLLAGVPLGLFLVVVSGYLLAQRSLQPMAAMASRARRIGVLNLKERIPVKNRDDELGHLASSFNDLLDRLERSFESLKRFTADASHQLRTPLTAIRSVGEVGLQGVRTAEQYRETIGSMLEDIGRLTMLVDNLLFLSGADAGRHRIVREATDLLLLARETAGLISILAEEREQTLRVDGNSGLIARVDRSLISQAVLNLLDNAIKFSPPRSDIVITVHPEDSRHIRLGVSDRGAGIPPDQREQIFQRFYRLDTGSRTRHPGAGLGLAIARWAVEANDGRIAIENREGGGNIFVISLPTRKEQS